MKNLKFKEILPNLNGGKYPFNEMDLIKNEDGIYVFRRRSSVMIIGAIIVQSKDYVAKGESEYADQLDNFALQLAKPEYQIQYGYDDAFKEEAAADAAYNRYTYTKRSTVKDYEKTWTAKKNEVRHGSGITVTPFEQGVDVSTPPPAVAPGNEDRFRNKSNTLKANVATTEAAEKAMGIFTVHTDVDPSLGKPDLTYELVAGGHPKLLYTKGVYQGIELEVDRGDGNGFVLIGMPSNPSFVDNGTLPPIGKALVWRYRAIYRLDDARIGDYCDPVSVPVHGV